MNDRKYDESFFRDEKRIIFDRGLEELESELKILRTRDRNFPQELEGGIVDFLRKQVNPVVLDAPCGTGKLLDEIGTELGGEVKLIGVDKFGGDHDFVEMADLDSGIPAADHEADLLISMYGIRYLKDPLSFTNEALRVVRKGGYIIMNGIRAMRLRFENNGQVDEVRFFTDHLEEDPERIKIYKFRNVGDWVIIQIIDPDFRFDFKMVDSYSIFVGSQEVDVRRGARFVYERSQTKQSSA